MDTFVYICVHLYIYIYGWLADIDWIYPQDLSGYIESYRKIQRDTYRDTQTYTNIFKDTHGDIGIHTEIYIYIYIDHVQIYVDMLQISRAQGCIGIHIQGYIHECIYIHIYIYISICNDTFGCLRIHIYIYRYMDTQKEHQLASWLARSVDRWPDCCLAGSLVGWRGARLADWLVS